MKWQLPKNESISTDLGIILDKLQGLLDNAQSVELFDLLQPLVDRVRDAMYQAIEEEKKHEEHV